MSWAEVTEGKPAALAVPVVVDQVYDGPISRLYISNLHKDTSSNDVRAIFEVLCPKGITDVWVSKLQRSGVRYAKVAVPAPSAQDIIELFNMIAGVVLGHSTAEFARS